MTAVVADVLRTLVFTDTQEPLQLGVEQILSRWIKDRWAGWEAAVALRDPLLYEQHRAFVARNGTVNVWILRLALTPSPGLPSLDLRDEIPDFRLTVNPFVVRLHTDSTARRRINAALQAHIGRAVTQDVEVLVDNRPWHWRCIARLRTMLGT